MSRLSASPAIRRRKQAQVERDGHEVVADFVGHVRGHLAQVGQAVLPGQFAVLDLQLVGQLLHLLAQGLVRLLQPQRGRVPGRQTVCRSAFSSSNSGSGDTGAVMVRS